MADRDSDDRMPLRDADLRHAATEAEVRPGDAAWRCLVELQRRRDAERAPIEFRTGAGHPR